MTWRKRIGTPVQAISIVTPTFRMARFLPEAIESVLSQGIPDVDYFIADGGSDDGTVEILRRYQDRLSWRSAPDKGAADALATAFSRARGDILGWLNADDVLLPGALPAVLKAFEQNPRAVAVFGGADWIDESGKPIRPYPVALDAERHLSEECLICQPACFFRADAYRAAGGIDPSYSSAFDYEFWIRLSRMGPMVGVPGNWALSRMHAANKSLGQRQVMFKESIEVLSRYYGYVPFKWIYCRRANLIDGSDQFFTPLVPSRLAFLLSLTEGLVKNRRQWPRYLREWGNQVTWPGFLHMIGMGKRPDPPVPW